MKGTMTMKKKVTLILTTILLLTSLASCGEQTTSKSNTVTPTPTVNIVTTPDLESNNPELVESDDKISSESNTRGKTVDEIIESYNSKIKTENSGLPQNEINALLVYYDRNEIVSQYNITSYEYSTPNDIIGICLYEDIDTREVVFGSIEINKAFINSNGDTALSGFMQMCYYLTYAFDSSTTEDKFMEIWRTMRNNENMQASYSDVMYQIYEYSDYLMYAIKYSK